MLPLEYNGPGYYPYLHFSARSQKRMSNVSEAANFKLLNASEEAIAAHLSNQFTRQQKTENRKLHIDNHHDP